MAAAFEKLQILYVGQMCVLGSTWKKRLDK